jgi:hypothetical protein
VLPLERFVIRSDGYAEAPGLAVVAAECVLYAFVYLATVRLLDPVRCRAVRDLGTRAVAKLSRLSRRAL